MFKLYMVYTGHNENVRHPTKSIETNKQSLILYQKDHRQNQKKFSFFTRTIYYE